MYNLESFSQLPSELRNQNGDKISMTTLGAWTRRFTEIHIPLYENFKGELENSQIPCIEQFSEKLETDMLNGKEGRLFTILGSDGK